MRLDKAERSQAPGERFELRIADPAGVSRVRVELVDRDVFDGEGGEGSHACPIQA